MSIAHLLNQTITHYAEMSYDEYGKEQDAQSGTPYKARVQEVTKMRQLPNGQIATITAIVYITGKPNIKRDDRIDFDGTTYRVYGVNTMEDGLGKTKLTRLDLSEWDK